MTCIKKKQRFNLKAHSLVHSSSFHKLCAICNNSNRKLLLYKTQIDEWNSWKQTCKTQCHKRWGVKVWRSSLHKGQGHTQVKSHQYGEDLDSTQAYLYWKSSVIIIKNYDVNINVQTNWKSNTVKKLRCKSIIKGYPAILNFHLLEHQPTPGNHREKLEREAIK